MSAGENTTETIPPTLVNLTDEQVTNLKEILEHLIDHIAKRIEYAESRRNQHVVVSGTIVAASVALLSLVFWRIEYLPLFLALLTLSVSGIIIGGLVWVLYARQTNFRYPFTATARTWKWFYRYALPNYQAFSPPWHLRQSKEAFRKGQDEFQAQWSQFTDQQIKGLTDPRVNVFQDLQQVYLLHVNERYKNLFLTTLRSVVSYGLVCAFTLALLSFVIGLFLQKQPLLKGSGAYNTDKLIVNSSWLNTKKNRSIGIGSGEVQLLLNIRIQNLSNEQLTINGLIPKDSSGMQLPVLLESIRPSPLLVPAGSTLNVVALAWIPQSLVGTINYFEVNP